MGQQSKNNSDEKKLIALGRVLQTLREEDNVDVLLDSTLNYLQTELEYSLIWIGFYDRLDHRILGKGGITPTGDNTFLKNKFFLQPGDLLEQVVIQQRPVGVANLAEEVRAGEWRKAAANYNIRGTLLFPIRYRDRCFGVVLLGSPQWGISPRSEEKARLSILLGGLAAALNQIEVDWNRTRMKRPDEPMFRMLDRLPRASSMLQRLEAIVAETHQFVAPTRTSIFWFERERRYFWRRMSNRQAAIEATPAASGITVQESGGFYNALVADQTVSIGESRSSLKADITSRLLQRLGARSLIAAPIRLGDELLGFLGCEANEPRIWKEEEKNYIRAAAQLIALISPMEEMEAIVEQTKQDQTIASEITTAITSEEDWQQTVKTCAEQLTKRLQVDRFLVLLLDPEQQQFEICYQSHPVNRRPIGQGVAKGNSQPTFPHLQSLPALSQVDWQMLERNKEAVGIEDLSSDLKLLLWRDAFLEAGVRSLLICNTSIGRPLTGMLVATSENPRTWTGAEREIFRVVSQQLGLILNQWQLQRQVSRQEKAYQSLQWALTTMNAASPHSSIPPDMGGEWGTLGGMEGAALQSVVTMIGAEVAALVSWMPGSDRGQIITTPVINHQFAINSEPIVSVKNDPLIQEALTADSLIIKSVSELAATTRNWICGTGISEVLAIALRTAPEHATLGVVVVGTSQYHIPTTNVLPMFGVLISQLAWSRRLLIQVYTLAFQRQQLQCLNWYKHRLVEDLYLKTWSTGHRASGIEKSSANAVSSIAYMLSNEYWKIAEFSQENLVKRNPQSGDSIKLTTLLLRSMERIDSVVKNRHIWTQIHDAGGNEKVPIVSLENGPRLVKIELIIYEILVSACDRCPDGGRIDIWYRLLGEIEKEREVENKIPLPFLQLELSITDNGRLDPQLISDLQNIPSDELSPSSLDKPPGLHLRICQLLIKQMGGELNFYQIDDGRILSRLILPI